MKTTPSLDRRSRNDSDHRLLAGSDATANVILDNNLTLNAGGDNSNLDLRRRHRPRQPRENRHGHQRLSHTANSYRHYHDFGRASFLITWRSAASACSTGRGPHVRRQSLDQECHLRHHRPEATSLTVTAGPGLTPLNITDTNGLINNGALTINVAGPKCCAGQHVHAPHTHPFKAPADFAREALPRAPSRLWICPPSA